MENIDKLCWKYMKQGVSFVAGFFLVGLFVIQVGDFKSLLIPLVISAIYALIIEVADAQIWKCIAKRVPDSISNFFIGVSAFRMLSALAVLFIYYFICGRNAMLVFFLVFVVFYAIILIHHTAFFRNHTNIAE